MMFFSIYRLYAVGGFSGKNFLNSIEYLDANSNEWTTFVPKSDGVCTPASSLQSSFSDPSLNGIFEKNVMNVSTSSSTSDCSTVSERNNPVYGNGMESLTNYEKQQKKIDVNSDSEIDSADETKKQSETVINGNGVETNGAAENPTNGTAESNGTNDEKVAASDLVTINGSQEV